MRFDVCKQFVLRDETASACRAHGGCPFRQALRPCRARCRTSRDACRSCRRPITPGVSSPSSSSMPGFRSSLERRPSRAVFLSSSPATPPEGPGAAASISARRRSAADSAPAPLSVTHTVDAVIQQKRHVDEGAARDPVSPNIRSRGSADQRRRETACARASQRTMSNGASPLGYLILACERGAEGIRASREHRR